MMISTKGRYALRVMIDIAEHQHDGYIPLKEIAARQEISEKYLEAIVKSLVKERYLTGLRGKSGGYRLTRTPEEYTVGNILRLTEGSLAPVACLEQNPVECRRMAECRTLPMWRKLNTMINDYFDSISLADLVNTAQPGNNYVIGPKNQTRPQAFTACGGVLVCGDVLCCGRTAYYLLRSRAPTLPTSERSSTCFLVQSVTK